MNTNRKSFFCLLNLRQHSASPHSYLGLPLCSVIDRCHKQIRNTVCLMSVQPKSNSTYNQLKMLSSVSLKNMLLILQGNQWKKEDGVTHGPKINVVNALMELLVSVFPSSLSPPPPSCEPSEPGRQLIFYHDKAKSMQPRATPQAKIH